MSRIRCILENKICPMLCYMERNFMIVNFFLLNIRIRGLYEYGFQKPVFFFENFHGNFQFFLHPELNPGHHGN